MAEFPVEGTCSLSAAGAPGCNDTVDGSVPRAAVTRHGNLLIESPKGVRMTAFDEGYALCEGPDEAFAYDMPIDDDEVPGLNGEADLAAASVTQPKPGKFPLTIVRRTLDGRLRLTQTWAAPDASENDATVTMTVRNVGPTTVKGLSLMRSAASRSRDGDPFFNVATTADSVFQWWEHDADASARGLVMMARSVGKPHIAGVATDIDTPSTAAPTRRCTHRSRRGVGISRSRTRSARWLPESEAAVVFVYRRL